MVMSGKRWNLPKDNEIWYSYKNVMQIIKSPEMLIEYGEFFVLEITE